MKMSLLYAIGDATRNAGAPGALAWARAAVSRWNFRVFVLVPVAMLWVFAAAPARADYDPMKVGTGKNACMDLMVNDTTRGRQIPVRIFLPPPAGLSDVKLDRPGAPGNTPAPVIVFSHGLGGSRQGCAYLGRHWSARGYAVVYVQHPGSDTTVWKGKPFREMMSSMQEAANGSNYLLRVKDVPAVLDQLEQWNREEGHILHRQLDLRKVGMSGHSFGAITTQAVSGQRTPGGRALFTDRRIRAAIAFSPSCPKKGRPEQAFGKVSIPWLLMTGTKDLSLIGGATIESRLGVFAAVPATGDKYEVVLHNAEHSAFTDRRLPGDKEERNPNHHRAILALSTAFWDAYLSDEAAAKAWLDGNGPESILEAKDRWRRK